MTRILLAACLALMLPSFGHAAESVLFSRLGALRDTADLDMAPAPQGKFAASVWAQKLFHLCGMDLPIP